MARATVKDAFDAATYFAQQWMGVGTAKLREKNELDVKVQSMQILTDIENWKRDNPFVGGDNEYDDNYRRDEYLGKMNNFIGQRYAQALGNNGSQNYHDQMKQHEMVAQVHAKSYADLKQDEWRFKRNEGEYEGLKNKIYNSDDWDTNIKMEALMEAHESHSKRNGWDPITTANDKAKIVNALFNNALAIDISSIGTVEQAHALIDKNIKDFEDAFLKQHQGKGIIDDWIQNKQALLDAAKYSAQKNIWKREFTRLDTFDNEWRRRTYDAMRTENYNELMGCIQDYYAGVRMRDAALQSNNYNPDDKPRIAGMFPLPAGLLDGGDGSGSRKDIYKEIIKDHRQYILNNISEGRTAAEEGKSAFINFCGDLAAGIGIGIDDLELKYPQETMFHGFWEDAKDQWLNENPGYKAGLELLDTIVNPWKNEPKDPQERALRHKQGKRVAMYLWDRVLDSYGAQRLTPEDFFNETQRIVGLLIGDKISFLRETVDNSNEYKGGKDERKFADAIHEIAQHPWARFTMQGNTYTFGDQKYMENLKGEALDKFANITHIPKSNIVMGNVKEGPYDETAEFTFQITGRGDENGTFKFAADDKGDYWIEENTNGEWNRSEKFKKTESQTRQEESDRLREQHGEAQKQHEKQIAVNHQEEIFKLIENEEDPDRRKARIQNAQMPGDYSIAPDEFWKRGINPNSGESIKQIPAAVWDRIMKGLTAAEQEILKNKWQSMGISRGDR